MCLFQSLLMHVAAAHNLSTAVADVLCMALQTRTCQQRLLQGDYSCENIAKVPREEQCSFIRDKCPSGTSGRTPTHCVQQQATTCRHTLTSCFPCCGCAESLVPYAEWYFCHVAPHNVLLRTMYLVGDQHSGSGCSPAAGTSGGLRGASGGSAGALGAQTSQVRLTGCVQRQQQWHQAQPLPSRSLSAAPTGHITCVCPPPYAGCRLQPPAPGLLPAGRHSRVLHCTHHGTRITGDTQDAAPIRRRYGPANRRQLARPALPPLLASWSA